ncbi:ComF family protein [Caldovatus aquaticus]|uniref:Double zinc ribbon domain-containing protein n=1 Tax=Caldovatus aquaticus TaxID=2865671 RepID=A0ABS7F444_9PROT|nr:double zinc ribbon domain-containing protein [Caldovatus aquaticus]MBW8270390.1 double zinc ribbon domain-containing protein [Caldovatus aquaticus]
MPASASPPSRDRTAIAPDAAAPAGRPPWAAAGARLGAGLAAALRAARDALLPPHCLTCEAEVAVQGTLCAACFRGLGFITAPLCARCGVPFAHAGQADAQGLCPGCAADPPPFAAARAALRYDAGAKRLLLPFKHGDRTDLAAPLAAQMARAGAALLARADLVAPVPAHWRRRLARRYDQAALLARAVARLGGRPCVPDLLRRTRATPPLGERGAAERAALLAGAFALRRGGAARVAGRRVLLVDDVLTSGATAGACARVLLAAGAAAVDVLAAARVPDPRLAAGAAP